MQIPKVSHVPIQQPMYANGLMHQTWVRFFEALASLVDLDDSIDLYELMQRAHELPSQAVQGQQQMQIDQLNNQFMHIQTQPLTSEQLAPVAITPHANDAGFDLVSTPQLNQHDFLPAIHQLNTGVISP